MRIIIVIFMFLIPIYHFLWYAELIIQSIYIRQLREKKVNSVQYLWIIDVMH